MQASRNNPLLNTPDIGLAKCVIFALPVIRALWLPTLVLLVTTLTTTARNKGVSAVYDAKGSLMTTTSTTTAVVAYIKVSNVLI